LRIRASLGTLIALGLIRGIYTIEPGIAYVMQYDPRGCKASCLFCTQSSSSKASKELLSRVVWPVTDLNSLVSALKSTKKFRRVCLQTIIKDNFIEEAHEIVKTISAIGMNVSLSITPIPYNELARFKNEGVDYLGVGLDAFSEEIFFKVKKPYSWQAYWKFIDYGVKVFGKGRVIVHLIVGLGETLSEALKVLERVYNVGAEASLFAYTPVKGTPLANLRQPSHTTYRFLQLVTELLSRGYRLNDIIIFKNGKYFIRDKLIDDEVLLKALMTRGCPGCNRPFYNESPKIEPYNFPNIDYLGKYINNIKKEISNIVA